MGPCIELFAPFAEDAYGAVAVAEDGAFVEALVLPDGDVLLQLAGDFADEGFADAFGDVVVAQLPDGEAEAVVDVVFVNGGGRADQEGVD